MNLLTRLLVISLLLASTAALVPGADAHLVKALCRDKADTQVKVFSDSWDGDPNNGLVYLYDSSFCGGGCRSGLPHEVNPCEFFTK